MGSPLSYRFDHKMHHRFSDTDRDVHGPGQGYFFAHKTWMTENLIKLDTATGDKVLRFIHSNNYFILGLIYCGIGLISTQLLLVVAFATLINIIMGDVFNYMSHIKHPGSYRNHDTKDRSVNHIFWGYLAFCWHNNHHKTPNNCNEQHKWWEVDLLYHLIIKWIKV